VGIERGRDFLFRVVPRVLVRLEFRATVFANANDRGRGELNDPQASYRHSISRTHAEDITLSVEIKGYRYFFSRSGV